MMMMMTMKMMNHHLLHDGNRRDANPTIVVVTRDVRLPRRTAIVQMPHLLDVVNDAGTMMILMVMIESVKMTGVIDLEEVEIEMHDHLVRKTTTLITAMTEPDEAILATGVPRIQLARATEKTIAIATMTRDAETKMADVLRNHRAKAVLEASPVLVG